MLPVIVKLGQTTLTGFPAMANRFGRSRGKFSPGRSTPRWLILGGAAVGWVLSLLGYV